MDPKRILKLFVPSFFHLSTILYFVMQLHNRVEHKDVINGGHLIQEMLIRVEGVIWVLY